MSVKNGIAGKIAQAFLESKLSLLLMLVFLAVGIYSTFLIPREEEPQIDVPMADIFVYYPGASPTEVESRVSQPLEKILSNIPGVEHIYSTSMFEQSMLIVQFYVGEDVERSLVKLYDQLYKHLDIMPKGVSMPLVKSRSIDDVPVLGLTLWSENYDDYALRKIAVELQREIEKTKDVSTTKIIGGRSRQLKIIPDASKMLSANVDLSAIAQSLRSANQQQLSGTGISSDREFIILSGNFITSVEELEQLIIGTNNGQPIYLKQVAQVELGPEVPGSYTGFSYGAAHASQNDFSELYPAVTLSIAKRKGADAMQLADKILAKTNQLKQHLIPNDVQIEITRNYGATASQKVSELLLHLIVAIIAVTIVVMLAMGWRGGLVVFLSVPVTFALTLFSYYLLDYTLNRITLFALVFVTGIVVDDSIIIAENMHRHFKLKKLSFREAAIYSINEVGNPTILATLTVIASVLPMAFVSGLMGPYMSPMPIGASIAMILSLLVALTITPYLGYHFLRANNEPNTADSKSENKESNIYKVFRAMLLPLLESVKKRWVLLLVSIALLLGSVILIVTKVVTVKMLPFDNKNELQIIIDMPEGTSLERTAVVTNEIGEFLKSDKHIKSFQTYVGTAAPITFNGLIRHYDLRQHSHSADIQINLTDKSERKLQSHTIAKQLRPQIQNIAKIYNANVKVVEVPPGPPVLSTLVAEVYGPNYEQQIQLAKQIKTLLASTENVVDVDWTVEDDQIKQQVIINHEKAALNRVSEAQIIENIGFSVSKNALGRYYQPNDLDEVPLVFEVKNSDKSNMSEILRFPVTNKNGHTKPMLDFVSVTEDTMPKSIYRKNQQRVVYVLADMAGDLESPVYVILGFDKILKSLELPKGYKITERYLGQPEDESDFILKWDGEWQITLEVFRDLGIAFVAVIFIIYMLIVGWFQSFKTPIVMMLAIPLSLVGIVIAHWIFNAYFTATSFIGMIALAGIMVRNSVLLIDFANLRLAQGASLKEAVIEAGAVRATPILLTAGTVVIGAFVILFDPIFQGLALSLMGGAIASTLLTLLVVPIIYFLMQRKRHP